MTSPCISDVLPAEILRTILRYATSSPRVFDTSPENVSAAAQETANLLSFYGQDILDSLPTKRSLSRVSKLFHQLVEEFLLEAIVVTEYDRLAQLRIVLSSERSMPRSGNGALLKGSYCRRMDFLLGRRGHYWAGEGQYKGFKSLWGLLPNLTNLELLIIDPYQSGTLWETQITLSKGFWSLLRTRCAHSLRLLHINNVEADAGHIHLALAPFTNLESLELRGGWHGRTLPPETPTTTLPRLHNLRAFYPEIMSSISMPALQHAAIITSTIISDGSTLKIRPDVLTELDYCGPPMDIFELCDAFPNLRRFGIYKPRISNPGSIPWTHNGGCAEKLEEIDVFNLHSLSLAPSLIHTLVTHCRVGSFPALRRVKYVEQECYFHEAEVQSVEPDSKSLTQLGIDFIIEKKWFPLY
ncbi:SubName: Full=Uncharacterized protein {ECO:0000313/EMBL:CCA67521.1} [Serendipita indica DSM 11827]|uniref:F-box domain-containing protein n=1 Tax=Serendipita indica (strain DSM 11827) TaxID=1109443 RepID=G4T864_SERID|nr:SubName: Full=Uncharacterized protein {ECO:0000313/EMBL:CCA67521.1} [Serendipita indica DSM 11827]CCA67521.1 hypothetical protein PIIN_01350 [Serendipita indica DSM 11827]